jgi:hypothetical protein
MEESVRVLDEADYKTIPLSEETIKNEAFDRRAWLVVLGTWVIDRIFFIWEAHESVLSKVASPVLLIRVRLLSCDRLSEVLNHRNG